MWVSTHVLAGLGIAAALGGPWWLLVILVVAAHIVMDLIPHWDYTTSRHPLFYGVCDFIASLAVWLLAWLVLGMPFWMAFMGPVSGAPDWDVLVAEIRHRPDAHFFPSHLKSFPHGRAGRPWGIGVQVVIMAASVTVVLALRSY